MVRTRLGDVLISGYNATDRYQQLIRHTTNTMTIEMPPKKLNEEGRRNL